MLHRPIAASPVARWIPSVTSPEGLVKLISSASGQICTMSLQISNTIGKGDNAPLSETDETVFDDGSVDYDFEETTLEALEIVKLEAAKIMRLCDRFQYNIMRRAEQRGGEDVEQESEE